MPRPGARRQARQGRRARVGGDRLAPRRAVHRADAAAAPGRAAARGAGPRRVRRARHEIDRRGQCRRHTLQSDESSAGASGLPPSAADGVCGALPYGWRRLRGAAARDGALPPQGRLHLCGEYPVGHPWPRPALRLPRHVAHGGRAAAASRGACVRRHRHRADSAAAGDDEGRLHPRRPLARRAGRHQRGRLAADRAARHRHAALAVHVRRRPHQLVRAAWRGAARVFLLGLRSRPPPLPAAARRDRDRVPRPRQDHLVRLRVPRLRGGGRSASRRRAARPQGERTAGRRAHADRAAQQVGDARARHGRDASKGDGAAGL
mmetsp:Transcript_54535/g.162044  ORF Transcript_54535/g.162044 Transcript_54535/m.162044 type:complete len:320 (-) Transcript_54535:93-1052(-)